MHGNGNDFIVVDAVRQRVALSAQQIRAMADRHTGVGFDQLLLVEPPPSSEVEFRYRIFNADGGEVEQCGNGARCFVRFVREQGLTDKSEVRVATAAGVITLRMEASGQVTVDMGMPRLEPAQIPFLAERRNVTYPLEVDGRTLSISAVSMGNPHAVQVVADVERAPVASEGPLIEQHARFPKRVNAGYVQILDRNHVKLRVWERGAGETLACGTGACAAVVAGHLRTLLDDPVRVATRGGELLIRWQGEGTPVYLTGDAATVFEGEIEL